MSDSTGTILVAVFGWIYLFYLNNRTLRRSEISRQKDRLIERLESVRSWYIDEIRLDFEGSNRLSLEQNLSAHVTQIELRIRQLNYYIGTQIVGVENLSNIRGIDNGKDRPVNEIIGSVHSEFSDLAENIELSYDRFFEGNNLLTRIWVNCRSELLGGIFGLAILGLIFHVVYYLIS